MSRLLDLLFPNPYMENKWCAGWDDPWHDPEDSRVSDYTWHSWETAYEEFCQFFGCDSGLIRKW